jgi:hypothetical protein
MKNKSCKRCQIEKPLNDFYPHSKMADGTLNFCKQCKRQESEDHRNKRLKDPDWVGREIERQRLKSIKRRCQFPEKTIAHNACRQLQKKTNKHLHHWSYLPEHRIDVFEMSLPDHRFIHCYMKYDQERMMYRRVDTMELLDTRDKAESFYNEILPL